MSDLQGQIVLFVCLLLLTAYRSYKGDDDVVYQALGRKFTQREALIRFRWVVLKTITSVIGGAVLGIAEFEFIRLFYPLRLSGNQAVLLAFISMGIVSILIGVLQNEIRHLCGRQYRPVIDWGILRHNLMQWLGKS